MRMWNVEPRIMCRQHLLGEHLEIHMFLGSLRLGKSLDGYIRKGILEIHNLIRRHEELVQEMRSRKYNHWSPIQWCPPLIMGHVDREKSLRELLDRCERCRRRKEESGG